MSKSPSENNLYDYEEDDSAAKSFENSDDKSDRDVDEDVDRRPKKGGRKHEDNEEAEEPEKEEDPEDEGYGGEENGEDEEVEEKRRKRRDSDEEVRNDEPEEEQEITEIEYEKGGGGSDEGLYDEDEDESRIRKNKKKKRDKSDKPKRRKKVKREGEAEEAEEDKYAEEIEEGYERKTKKGRKKGKEEEVDEEQVENLLNDMENAYEEDIISFKNKQPALNKLKLLPKVEDRLKRAGFQKAFIDSRTNGLEIISRWLKKLPNGVAPSLQLKRRLVDIIFQLPVTDEHLKSSEIGKVIYGMRNDPTEDPELKKTLKDIVDKWTRLITEMANDYSNNVDDIRDRKKIDISLDDYRQRHMSSLRKSIPRMTMKKSGFDFVRRPQNERVAMRSVQSQRQQANDEADRIIKDLKRKMRKEFK
jgi:transcription factor SPN1